MMTTELAGHHHVFVPADAPDAPTLLLLHGTGGNEHDLLELGRMLRPGAALLSPRGNVLEHGAPRFFRRLAEGVFDLDDLHVRTRHLIAFVREAVIRYQLDASRVVAVGFSNGANIAASVLLDEPGVLPAAILFRAMVPFEPEPLPRLSGTSVYMGAGRGDPMIPAPAAERLAWVLRESGADVTLEWQPGGHGLTQMDVDAARRWLDHWETTRQ